MGIFSSIGDAVKGVGHVVGKVAANPIVDAGIAMIPGVGVPGAALAGGLGRLMAPGGNAGEALKGGAEGAMAGFGGEHLASMGSGGEGIMGKLGNILGQAKNQIGESIAPGGKIDFSKIIGAGGTIASMLGQAKQRKSAEGYANSQIDQRNELMNKIMAPQNYGLPPITPAKSVATNATSAGIGY